MNPKLLRTLAAAGLAAACAHVAAPRDDVHLIPGRFTPDVGPDGNTEIFPGPDGLVVVDTGRHPEHSRKILEYARERGAPIAAIVNTHWHFDHVTGNGDLMAAYPDATLYATRGMATVLAGRIGESADRVEEGLKRADIDDARRARLTRFLNAVRHPDTLIPDVEVAATTTIAANGRDLELHVTDHAVSEADIWIWDPATRTVVAGDLVTLPAPLFDSGCPEGWTAALDAVEEKPFARLIPGHGAPMSPAEYRVYRDAFDALLACAADHEGATCAEGWVADADVFLTDPDDRAYAREAVVSYVDEIIRSDEIRRANCGAS
jgi:glyoxylase-like metal-dependent hydrolase (beta-lactamase superfamily II)